MKNANPSGSSRHLSILGILGGTMAAARRFAMGEAIASPPIGPPLIRLPSRAPSVFGQSRECAKLRRKSRLRSAGIGGQRQ